MPTSNFNHTTTLVFTRKGAADVALLTMGHNHPMTSEELLEKLESALALWVEVTEAGEKAWLHTCYDFNIGDLASYGVPEIVSDILSDVEAGIINLEVLPGDALFSFDRVLVDSECVA